MAASLSESQTRSPSCEIGPPRVRLVGATGLHSAKPMRSRSRGKRQPAGCAGRVVWLHWLRPQAVENHAGCGAHGGDPDKEKKILAVEREGVVQQLAGGHGAQGFYHGPTPGST